MTTSGTTAFNLNLTEIMEEAFERVGREMRSGYDFRTAKRSLNLLLAEWANRGFNMWTLDSDTIAMVSGTATYNLPVDTVDLIEHVIRTGSGTTQVDYTISRIGVSDYAAIPNKTNTGRPLQVFIDRQITPTVTLWPVPDSSNYTLVYWRLRRLEDAGNGVNDADIPFRFLPALIAGLAFHIAGKVPEGADKIDRLKAEYEEHWLMASTEDREKAPIRFVPRGYGC